MKRRGSGSEAMGRKEVWPRALSSCHPSFLEERELFRRSSQRRCMLAELMSPTYALVSSSTSCLSSEGEKRARIEADLFRLPSPLPLLLQQLALLSLYFFRSAAIAVYVLCGLFTDNYVLSVSSTPICPPSLLPSIFVVSPMLILRCSPLTFRFSSRL